MSHSDHARTSGFEQLRRRALDGRLPRRELDRLLDDLLVDGAAGDGDALEQVAVLIYDLPTIRSTIGRVLFAPDDVDDALQDTVLAIVAGAAAHRPGCGATARIDAVARFKALDVLDRKRRAAGRSKPESKTEPGSPVEPDDVAAFSSLLANRLDLEALLDRLPERLAEVVRLRDVEQLSYDDIAERLDLKLNTVKSRLARGRARLAPLVERRYER